MSAKPPAWAKAPGPDWKHRGNFSDTDVVWYHEPTNAVLYQLGEHYIEPGQPVPSVGKTHMPPKVRRHWRLPIVAISAATSGVVSALVAHFVR